MLTGLFQANSVDPPVTSLTRERTNKRPARLGHGRTVRTPRHQAYHFGISGHAQGEYFTPEWREWLLSYALHCLIHERGQKDEHHKTIHGIHSREHAHRYHDGL